MAARRRSGASIQRTGRSRAPANYGKLPSKQKANMGPGTMRHVANDPTQLRDKDDVKGLPEVGLKARRRR